MQRWEYRVLTIKNPDVRGLDAQLTAYGAAGWELVTALTTVKTWINLSGNDLVLVFKRKGSGEADPSIPLGDEVFDPATGMPIR